MSWTPPADPAALLAEWLPANDDPVRPLMALTTIAEDGGPDVRHLLLSEHDADGLYFHTDARSRKCAQLAADPRAAIALFLPEQRRQLVARGRVEPAPAAEVADAYRRRSPYLQQLAWQNTPDFAVLDQATRIAEWAAFAAAHSAGLAQPDSWTGYRLRPDALVFWFGEPDTASRRAEYLRTADGWSVSVLAG